MRVSVWLRVTTVVLAGVVSSASFEASQAQQQQQQQGKQGQKPPAQGAAAAPKPKDPNAWPDDKTIAERKKTSEGRKLFQSDQPLEITLTANFKAVNGDRNPNSTKTFPATIEFAKADGTKAKVPLKIRARGHARRQICAFAPLRLELPKEQTKDTVFDGHGVLKLGTHCHNTFEEYVRREYAAYKIYNLLTPKSFRVRLAKVTYVDATNGKAQPVHDGMFIEDDDDVARRLEGRVVELKKLIFQRVDQESVVMTTLFEYLVANTDVSLYALHNLILVQTKVGQRYMVPYDFDYSGLVDAQYAVAGKGLGISSVRDRLYRGPCLTAAEFEPYFARFRAAKPAIMALYDTIPDMPQSYRNKSKSYLEEFYKTLDRPSEFKRTFVETCKPYM
jgi:hypothetical protein